MSVHEKEQWGTRIGVILAVAGSAVGLGNFLRFPGQAAQHGGGAFMIPYFCALVLLGFPIGWAEWVMGRYAGQKGLHSAPGVLGVFGKGSIARYFGVIGVLIPLVVYMYYGFIESWCLRYAWEYVVHGISLGTDPSHYAEASARVFTEHVGSDRNGVLLAAGGIHPSVIFWAITFALNLYFVYRGLSKGIERFCSWAMPAMALCALIVLGRVLTLGTPDPSHPDQNVISGLGFMWNPKFSELGDFSTWLAAAGQVFFSLSVGFGVILNYASYLKRKSDVVLSGLTASATNELFEVGFGGMITIPAAVIFLGTTGAVGAVAGGTFGLGFNTLPVVFMYMGGVGRFVGAVWFFMLFLAAITSSLSMFQPVKAFLQEALGLSNRGATILLGLIAGGGSFWVIWFSKGLVALDTIDFWVGTALIFVLATVQIICFSWVFGVDKGMAEANRGAHFRIPPIFRIIFKYVAPAYLLIVFAGFCIQNLPGYLRGLEANPVATATLGMVGAVLLFLIVATVVASRRWRGMGLDLDGRLPAPEVEEGRP
jgi:NSS family neurotransmitter:Na+ symporter